MEKNAEKVKWGGGIRRGGVIILELWAESTLTAGGASVASFERRPPAGWKPAWRGARSGPRSREAESWERQLLPRRGLRMALPRRKRSRPWSEPVFAELEVRQF